MGLRETPVFGVVQIEDLAHERIELVGASTRVDNVLENDKPNVFPEDLLLALMFHYLVPVDD